MELGFARAGILIALCLFVACGQEKKIPANSAISGPFDVAALPLGSGFMIVNSATTGEYSEGSIVEVAVSDDGTWSHQVTTRTDRLGTSVAVNSNGTLVAVGYGGERSRIALFSRENNGQQSFLGEWPLGERGIVSQLRFVTVGTDTFLHGVWGARSRTAKVLLWNVIDMAGKKSLNPLLVLPEDFGIEFPAFSAISILEDSGLAVAFPVVATGSNGLPDVFDFLRGVGEVDTPWGVTAVVFRLSDLVANQRSRFILTPIVFDISGYSGDGSLADWGVGRVAYGRAMLESFHPTGGKCTADYSDTLVTIDSSEGMIWEMSGWSRFLTDDFSSAFTAINIKDHVQPHVVSARIHHRMLETVGVDLVPRNARVLSLTAGENNTTCRPAWIRYEDRSNQSGNARTWLEWRDSSEWNSASLELPRGSGVIRGVGSGQLVGVSYSYDSITNISMVDGGFAVTAVISGNFP